MESITSLIKQLKSANYTTPSGQTISIKRGDSFRWDPNRLCLFYNPAEPQAGALVLHELGHALLGHGSYRADVELLAMERAAWDRALALATAHGVVITDDTAEDHLDTYRDWLHARSLCPTCGATGLQAAAKAYQCLSCSATWAVNEARTCGLKRYKLTKKP